MQSSPTNNADLRRDQRSDNCYRLIFFLADENILPKIEFAIKSLCSTHFIQINFPGVHEIYLNLAIADYYLHDDCDQCATREECNCLVISVALKGERGKKIG